MQLTHAQDGRGPRRWLIPLGVVTLAVVAIGVLADRTAPSIPEAALLVCASIGWLYALRPSATNLYLLAVCLAVVGLAGAALELVQHGGPGFVLCYMAATGLALRLPRRPALLLTGLVVGAAAYAEAATSASPVAAAIQVALGVGFLFTAASYAASSREGRAMAEALLAQEEAARAAREESAALAERARLARELHDVLAHTLSGLALHLEGARLIATATGADPRLRDQVTAAGRLARDGMVNAKRAVSALRGDALPGPAALPDLVAELAATTGVPIDFAVTGTPRPLVPEAGLAVYRTVQEALTNTAKYAGRTARARVRLAYRADSVETEITDTGGSGSATDAVPSMPSGGYGLAGIRERAALLGGRATSGPTPDGFRVHLTLPLATDRPPAETTPGSSHDD